MKSSAVVTAIAALVIAIVPPASRASGQAASAAPLRFRARAVSASARLADSLQNHAPAGPTHIPLSAGLPGALFAEVTPRRMSSPGRLVAYATGVWSLPADATLLRMFYDEPHILLGPDLAISTPLRITFTPLPGADYLIYCGVSSGSYAITQVAGAKSTTENYVNDDDGFIAFVLENAVAGPAVFQIESGTSWYWSGCQARTLT
jgi:hypothetical protein